MLYTRALIGEYTLLDQAIQLHGIFNDNSRGYFI